MSPLAAPPADPAELRRFPRRTVRPDRILYRIHRTGREPWWFSTDGSGRFDLVGQPGRGTCYVAEARLGAYVEIFRHTALVAEQDVDARTLSSLRVASTVVVADCTRARARSFGITAAIHASEEYARTQAWARVLAAAGFAGVRYRVSHDPAQRLVGLALFGPAGHADWPVRKTTAIDASLRREAQRRFGIRVVPVP